MARLNFKNDLINIKLDSKFHVGGYKRDFTAIFSPASSRCYKRDYVGGFMWTFISPRMKPQLNTRPTEFVIDFFNIWATRVFRWWIYFFFFSHLINELKKRRIYDSYRMCYGKGNIKYFRNNNSRLNCIQARNLLVKVSLVSE